MQLFNVHFYTSYTAQSTLSSFLSIPSLCLSISLSISLSTYLFLSLGVTTGISQGYSWQTKGIKWYAGIQPSRLPARKMCCATAQALGLLFCLDYTTLSSEFTLDFELRDYSWCTISPVPQKLCLFKKKRVSQESILVEN